MCSKLLFGGKDSFSRSHLNIFRIIETAVGEKTAVAWKSLGCSCCKETALPGSLWRRKETPPHFLPQSELRSVGEEFFCIGKSRDHFYGEEMRRGFNMFHVLSHYDIEDKASSLYMIIESSIFLLLPHHMITAINIHIYEPFNWFQVVSNLFIFLLKCGNVKQAPFSRSTHRKKKAELTCSKYPCVFSTFWQMRLFSCGSALNTRSFLNLLSVWSQHSSTAGR